MPFFYSLFLLDSLKTDNKNPANGGILSKLNLKKIIA